MLMQIFFSRSHPAPDVTLRLVCVEDFAGLAGKGGVDLEEALGDVWWCQAGNKKIILFAAIPILHVVFFLPLPLILLASSTEANSIPFSISDPRSKFPAEHFPVLP